MAPTLLLNYFGQGGLLLTERHALESVLSARPRLVSLPSRCVRYSRNDNCVASDHLRRIFAHPASNPARVSSTAERPPHRERGAGPNLCACRQLDPGGRHPRCGHWLRLVRQFTGAYGIAVSLLMAITTFLAALVAIQWGFNPVLVLAVNGFFLIVDLVSFGELVEIVGWRLVSLDPHRAS